MAAARYCVLAVPTVGTCSIIICRRACTKAGAGDFDIALLPFLTEAWARHDFDVLHAFVFLAVAVDGAELLSRGLLIGPTSASRARTAGSDGRMIVDFNIITRWQQRNAVDLPHHGRAFVSFLHFFYFFASAHAGDCLYFLPVGDELSFLSGIIYDKYFV